MGYKYSVAVACGGTGGHIFPGLATAQVLQGRGHNVTLWLAGKQVEQSAVTGWRDAIVTIPSEGVRGMIRSVKRSCSIMRSQKPDVVLAMGGFGSVGPCLAARLLGIPYFLHEANAVPGKAVRILSIGAFAVALHFEEARRRIHCRRVVLTGMPVRQEILSVVRRKEKAWFCLLVLGGSGGAHAVNEIVSATVCAMPRSDLRVIHLTGTDDEHFVCKRYADAGIRADVRPFEQNMASLYAEADFVICRAGASTCAEIAALNIPALLIPFTKATDDHQMANAQAFSVRDGIEFVGESDCSVEWLVDFLAVKITQRRRAVSSRSREAGSLAAEKLADVVEDCARKSG